MPWQAEHLALMASETPTMEKTKAMISSASALLPLVATMAGERGCHTARGRMCGARAALRPWGAHSAA
eukprot:scaffold569_cov408-Prasinococcus_capsulatus_cf.AAC.21